jgi:hypothetical protein
MNGLLVRATRPCCRVAGCRQPIQRFVEIRLPADWTTAGALPVLVLPVGACQLHAAELERRQRALGAARRDLPALTSVLQVAVATTLALRRDLAEAQLALRAQPRLAPPPASASVRDRREEVCA